MEGIIESFKTCKVFILTRRGNNFSVAIETMTNLPQRPEFPLDNEQCDPIGGPEWPY